MECDVTFSVYSILKNVVAICKTKGSLLSKCCDTFNFFFFRDNPNSNMPLYILCITIAFVTPSVLSNSSQLMSSSLGQFDASQTIHLLIELCLPFADYSMIDILRAAVL